AEPQNKPARQLLADVYEQLGYQAESTSVRNTFLQGAYELRNGLLGGTLARAATPDVVRAMSTGHWLDFLGISMDPKKAKDLNFTINLVTPDNGEKYIVELSNATLTNIEGFQDPKADLTITVDRADLNRVMMGQAGFDQLAEEGKAKFDGDRTVIAKLRDTMVAFTPDFEILPGTAPTKRQVAPEQSFALPDTDALIDTD
ncbi:MAG: alkyl sulfatase C-terminal domain-containing protein, partial [Chthoniobacterales bacterium]